MTHRHQSDHAVSRLPQVTGNVAMYTRAAPQKRHQNAATPSANLRDVAQQCDFSDDHILVFDQDNTLPGNTPEDHREGLQSLLAAIREGTVTAVFVTDLHRFCIAEI